MSCRSVFAPASHSAFNASAFSDLMASSRDVSPFLRERGGEGGREGGTAKGERVGGREDKTGQKRTHALTRNPG